MLEELRRNFCAIRKGMILSRSLDELKAFKRQSDLIVATLLLPDFRERFADIMDKIQELVLREERRTVKLANIIAVVNNYHVLFEQWSEDDIREDETIEEYIQRLMEEEEKADRYIPTEAKYKQGVTRWLVYYHKGRNRWYAKRIYFPGTARNIQMEGPGLFKNRFGREVWGVKITYEVNLRPTVIRRGNTVIHLPERWVKRTKVVPLPKEAEQVQLVEERPEVAYNIA